MSLRGIADVLGVKLDTVRFWLIRCVEHAEAVNDQLVREISVSRVELDELWIFVKKKRSDNGRIKGRQNVGLDSLRYTISAILGLSDWSSYSTTKREAVGTSIYI